MKTYEFTFRCVSHGETLEEAEEAALTFIAEAAQRGTLEACEFDLLEDTDCVHQMTADDSSDDYGGLSPSAEDICMGRYRLICTCSACPEQYDVYDDVTKRQVGYLRLRHGHFRADFPNCGGQTVYESVTNGDGVFDDDERMPQLAAAVRALEAAAAACARDE